MKKILTAILMLLTISACFPIGKPDRSELWVGNLTTKTEGIPIPDIGGQLKCKLLQEDANISGTCEFIASIFGISSTTNYLLTGTLVNGETKLQFASAKYPNEVVEMLGTYNNNRFVGKGVQITPNGNNPITTTYIMTLVRQIPVAPVRDPSYDATGRWNIDMDLKNDSNGRLNVYGTCDFTDSASGLRASCSLTDSQTRFSPTFTGKRTGVQAQMSYTSFLQDLNISFSGTFTDSRNFGGRAFLRDTRQSFSGTITMKR
jgi:hypothetical protein